MPSIKPKELERLAAAGKRMYEGGLTTGTLGAIGVRLPGGSVAVTADGARLGFMKKADLTYEPSTRDRATAEYANGKAGEKGTMMLKLSDLSPSIAFYLDAYGPGSMVKVPVVGAAVGRGVGAKYSLYLLYADTTVKGLETDVRNVGPRFVLVRDYSGKRSAPGEPYTAADLAAIAKPSYSNGNTRLFEASSLLSPAGAAGR